MEYVEQGQGQAAATAVNQHFAGPWFALARAHRLDEARNRFDRPRALAGQRRGEPIEEQVFGAAHDGVGNGLETQGCGELGEGLGGVVVVHR